MESNSNKDLFAFFNDVLLDAGYHTFFILDYYIVSKNYVDFIINQRPESIESTRKRVWLEYRFKDQRAEELFKEVTTMITNKLSGIYPEFNVVCTTDGRFRIRYCCDIQQAEDILPHIEYARGFCEKIQAEAIDILQEEAKEQQVCDNK